EPIQLRKSIFTDLFGARGTLDLVADAFKAAHAASPKAKLMYNDYNAEHYPKKLDSVANLVKALRRRGAIVDQVGFQGHMTIGLAAGPDTFTKAFTALASLPVDVLYTEVDVRTFTNDCKARGRTPAQQA